MANPRAGKLLQGRYRLRSILAEGGMGVVWQAERVGIERPVVVKFLQAVFSDRPGAVDRFEREARATARLNHPNCVQLVDYGLDEGQPYLVVEFVEGQTLAELLDKGPLDAHRAARIAVQTLAGLEHAHERGILHRDLKPANLMIIEAVGYVDFVKILDFGLAKIIGEADRREVTVHGVALGTPGYMSPEQAAGMPSDLRADVYSIGAVLYHLITGVKVFEGANVHSILRKHREDTPAPPRSLRGPGAISAELDEVVTRAMQRDPERRYQSAAEMRRAIELTPEGAPVGVARAPAARRPAGEVDEEGATRVGRAPPRPLPVRRRRARWPIAAGFVGVTVLAGVGFATYRLRRSPPEQAAISTELDGGEPAVVATALPIVDKPAAPATIEMAAADKMPEHVEHVEVTPLVTDGAVRLVDAGTVAAVVTTPIAAAPGATKVRATSIPPVTTTAIEPPLTELARVDDGADEDVRDAPTPPPQAPHREARDVRSIADVKSLIRRGETDLALAGLYQLRRRPGLTHDKQAEIATLLGHLYFDRRWVTDGLKEYRYALSLDLRARNDATIINNTVRALGDRTTAPRARRVLIEFVGRAAIPVLRRAADRPDTQQRAEEVLAKLGATRR